MKKDLDAVALFHDTFKVEQGVTPRLIDEKDFLLRQKLMAEENQEYLSIMTMLP
jgi:hypothetical protein